LSPCAILSEPGSRRRISSKREGAVLIRIPAPPMFVPEPGMKSTVVTPAASTACRFGLRGTTAGLTRRPALTCSTMSLMSPPEPPTWLCRSIIPGISQRGPRSTSS
jgi:hypothetical protein